MGKLFYFLFILLTAALHGQVGINTTTPETTFEVVGKPDDINHFDGVLPPRITGDQLSAKTYTLSKKGTIVFATLPATNLIGQVVNITESGLYYFDGSIWKSFEDDTLEDVVTRGNYSPKFISFIGSAISPSRDGALGMNKNTYSMFFGNMNPNHTGTYNISHGYGSLQNLTSGISNTAIGSFSLQGLTSGDYNTFLGYSSGYDFQNPNKIITGSVNVGIGNSTFKSLTTGYKNSALGQSVFSKLSIGTYNTAIGQNAGAFITNENKNVMVGAQTGAYVKGNNNVFIGTGAGHSNTVNVEETVNNRLVIHGNAALIPNPNIGLENVVDLSASWTNGLIIGDFAQRWIKFNGRFQINPSNISTSTADYTRVLVYNPVDGEVGAKAFTGMISIPTAPPTGNYVLKSLNGSVQWILE